MDPKQDHDRSGLKWALAGGLLLAVAALIFALLNVSRSARLQAELARTVSERDVLSTQLTSMDADQKALKETIASLEAEIAQISGELASAQSQTQEMERLKAQEEQLAQALKMEIEEGKARIEMVEGKLKLTCLDMILFDTGRDVIRQEGQAVLDRIAGVLKVDQAERTICIEGHTDDVPIGPDLQRTFRTNWELSTARALSVLHYLVDRHGLHPSDLSAVGHGEYVPLASNDTPEGRQQNRRVEIVLSPTQPKEYAGRTP